MPDKRPRKKDTAALPDPSKTTEVLEQLRALYREYESTSIPARLCSGRADCCRFRLTGETPHVTLPEALLVWQTWKKTGRTRVSLPEDGSCPCLNREGRCMVYEGRPFACRTHFCVEAGGALPRKMVQHLIDRLEDLDYTLRGQGAARLPDALLRLSRNA